jgi:hypothetical protein
MNENIAEYPNESLRHYILRYENNNKGDEFWHGKKEGMHNLNNPYWINWNGNNKINFKEYAILDYKYSKIRWLNYIKKI